MDAKLKDQLAKIGSNLRGRFAYLNKIKNRLSNFKRLNLDEVNLPSLNRIYFYLKIWLLMSKNSFMAMFYQKKLFFIFLLGKVLRFGFFIAFLYFLVSGTDNLAGYSVNQTIFFFLTFNLVDVLAQFLFREVYRYRPLVVSGDLDLILAKPISSLFRVLMGGADVIDFVTIPPLVAVIIYVGQTLNPSLIQIVYYVVLLINGLLIATAFHIVVLAIGTITLEVDHIIWMYRDTVNLGRLPIDIYKQPLRAFLTYLVPVGIMITLPSKALMGLVNPWGVFASFILGVVLVTFSRKFWQFSLKHYTSASS